MVEDNLVNESKVSDDMLNQNFDFDNLTSNPSNMLSDEQLNLPDLTNTHNSDDFFTDNHDLDKQENVTSESNNEPPFGTENDLLTPNNENVGPVTDNVSENLKNVDTVKESLNNSDNTEQEVPSDTKKMSDVKAEDAEVNFEKEVVDQQPENINEPAVESISKVKHAPTLYPQTHSILIPSYSHWFDLDKINLKEKEELPEFFIENQPDDISKTAQFYKTIRNFIVNTYRINPGEKISFFAVRRNLKGDAGSLLRIFKFLEKWGLINHQANFKNHDESLNEVYQIDNSTNEKVSQILGKIPNAENTKHFNISSDSSKTLYPFRSYKPSVSVQDLEYLKKIIGDGSGEGNDGARDISKTVELLIQKRKNDSSDEPSQNDNKRQKRDINWTDNEYKKLIELFYKYSEGGTSSLQSLHWLKISQEVNILTEKNGSKVEKTPADCILKILQIPIDDDYLLKKEDLGIFKYAPYLNGLGIEGSAGNSSQMPNPILETLITLIGYVEPERLKKMLEFIKEQKKQENMDQSDSNNDKIGSESNFKDLVNLGFASLAVRADKMALNEYNQSITQMRTLIEHSIRKINLKMEKTKLLEKVRFQEIEKTRKERVDQKLNLIRIKKGIAELEQKYDNDSNKELLDELKTLINSNHNFEKKEENLFVDDLEDSPKQSDDLPISIKDSKKYRYWSP